MTGDRPLWILVAGAVATYPGLWLMWCVSMLLGTHGSSRSIAADHLPEVSAYLLLATVIAASEAEAPGRRHGSTVTPLQALRACGRRGVRSGPC